MFYEYECGEHVWTELRRVADRDTPSVCPHCRKAGKRRLTLPLVRLDPISGHFPSATYRWEKWHTTAGRLNRGDRSAET